MQTETSGQKARTWLQRGRHEVLKKSPFFGYCALKLGLVERTDIPTLCTDGQNIMYNPEYVVSCRTKDDPPFVMAKSEVLHEVLHSCLGHCKDWAKKGYIPALVNMAQDFVINAMLKKEGYPLGPGWLYDARFEGMTWQDVYEKLKKEVKTIDVTILTCKVEPQPSPVSPGKGEGEGEGEKEEEGEGEGKAGTKGEGEEEEGEGSGPGPSDPAAPPAPGNGEGEGKGKSKGFNDWDRIVVEAARFAESQGNCPASVRDYVREITKPRFDWKAALARFMSRARKGDYSFRRPNKRYASFGLVMPSLHSYTADAFVAIDSSGSTMGYMPAFFGHLCQLSRTLKVPIDVAQIDTEVQNVFRLKSPDDVKKFGKDMGGGTDFRPMFEWLRKMVRKPEVVIFFTDGYGDYPKTPPPYKVLWCIPGADALKGSDYYPPFGQVLDLPTDMKGGN